MDEKIVSLSVNVYRKTKRVKGKRYDYYQILIPMKRIRILDKKVRIAIYPAEWINESQ